ncbi:MAG: hypothetical protein INF50_02710 [Rhodobacter sp.]|nr:hypothetical protein [Rhodobacter sp.]
MAVLAALPGYSSEADGANFRFYAWHLLSTAETADDFVIRRADDARAIKKLVAALKSADAAMQSLSKPTREALFHRLYMERHWQSFDDFVGITQNVGAKLGQTPFSDRENVRAIFIVQEARSMWAEHVGTKAPASSLNPESPFARFLGDLFRALGVGAEPRSAFQAWRKYRDIGVLGEST